MLSPKSSFMSTYSPDLILSTRLAGMGGSAGKRISGDRPDAVAGLGDARGLSREATYVGLLCCWLWVGFQL